MMKNAYLPKIRLDFFSYNVDQAKKIHFQLLLIFS